MKFKSIYLTLILILLIIFNINIEAKAESNLANKETIIIGLDVNFPPMGFLDESGEIVGFDIDLAREVFNYLGYEVEFQPINWDSKEMELANGSIDAIWNGLSWSKERSENMTLTKSYMKNRQVVIVNSNSDIYSISDLKEKTVSVQKSSTGATSLRKNEISSSLSNIFEVESMVNALNEVSLGMADATVVDEIVARYYLEETNLKSNFRILEEELEKEDYVIAVKKGNETLKEEIETALSDLIDNKKAEEISNLWFGENLVVLEDVTTYTESSSEISFLTPLLKGLKTTSLLFIIVIILSLPLGLLISILRDSKFKIFKYLVDIYTNIMRGTPLLLQLFFIFYGIPNIPVIGEYLTINNRFIAGAVAFVLNYAAYFTEIFRGGFLSIDKGQEEASKVLGFTKTQTLFKILLPQALKVSIPSICNETITLVKDTSLIFAIGVTELLSTSKNIVNSTANIMPYIIAAFIYLIICFAVSAIFKKLERKFSFV